jgi:nucleolin
LAGEPKPAYGSSSYGKSYGSAPTPAKGSTAFVGNLSYSTTKETLAKYFASCGKVIEIRIPLNEEGKPRGFAHIEFENEEACKKAIALSGNDLDGRSIKVDFSQPKGGDGGYGRRRGYGRGYRRAPREYESSYY